MRKALNYICGLLVFALVGASSQLNILVSYGATFKDVASIDSEKVEMVTDLGFLYYDLVPYFSPDRILTRKDAAEVMYILDKGYYYNDGDVSYINNFKDVYKNDYVINYCREQGLIRGYPDNTFKPNSPVTYAEIIEMFVKTLGFEDERVLEFPDEYISVGRDKGLLNDVEFIPDDYVTNLNAAKLVYNALTLPLYPDSARQNLHETRFDERYKLTLQTNDRIERMLVMLEEFDDNADIVFHNLEFEMIMSCYKQLAATNINCEFKYNHIVQFIRKANAHINTISKLKKEIAALDGMAVYQDFERYLSLPNEFYECMALLEADNNYDERLSGIMLNLIYNTLDCYEVLFTVIEQKLPQMEHFAALFTELEKDVLDAVNNSIAGGYIPDNFYNESNSISLLIKNYNNTEDFYNFMNEISLIDDPSYYDRMLELTYIIKSIYFITGYEYSLLTPNENESILAMEYYESSRELRDEIIQMDFFYYHKQIEDIKLKLNGMLETVY